MAKRRKKAAGFIGDKILAVFTAIGCTCPLGALLFLTAIALGLASPDPKNPLVPMLKEMKLDHWIGADMRFMVTATSAGVVAIGLFVVLGSWRGRAWAFVVQLILHGVLLGVSVYNRSFEVSVAINGSIAAYCLARLFGWVGPRRK